MEPVLKIRNIDPDDELDRQPLARYSLHCVSPQATIVRENEILIGQLVKLIENVDQDPVVKTILCDLRDHLLKLMAYTSQYFKAYAFAMTLDQKLSFLAGFAVENECATAEEIIKSFRIYPENPGEH